MYFQNNKRLWDLLGQHVGHRVEVASYSKDGEEWNRSIECIDCGEIILDVDNPEVYAKTRK